MLFSSRDGIHFDRSFMEAFIRPGLEQGNWQEHSLHMEYGVLQTSPRELSLYCMQYWRLPTVHIRHYTLCLDGFVSVQAGYPPRSADHTPVSLCRQSVVAERLDFGRRLDSGRTAGCIRTSAARIFAVGLP